MAVTASEGPAMRAVRDAYPQLEALDAKAERIVAAARELYTVRGYDETNVADIAEEAGVGVATVYRRFGTKHNLIRFAVAYEARRVLMIVVNAISKPEDPVASLCEGFSVLVREASAPKLLTRSLRNSSVAGEIRSELSDPTMIAGGRELLARAIEAWQAAGSLPAYDAAVVSELLSRLLMSLVANPEGVLPVRDAADAYAFARRHVAVLLFPAS
ncbi:TetR/AcrR family transcriptional regulator [Mycolicibacterium brumae]|uniref:TetR/AcrR family transcriptional regulator n=1 Tax=Mycolicibacterium brumae TaxID=85968 RepID=A0A2G5PD41_9MYCO|nr:TetR/AcrR family transcriptional regulator [Mycolicibacterium brumae]RWA15740.1 hypothetical protein MBRU_09315 [Mycolicibacterium brumae DSM 44177]